MVFFLNIWWIMCQHSAKGSSLRYEGDNYNLLSRYVKVTLVNRPYLSQWQAIVTVFTALTGAGRVGGIRTSRGALLDN